MVTETDIGHMPDRMRKSVVAVLFVTVILTTVVTFFGASQYFEKQELQAASNRMGSYLRSLNETLLRHQHLPFLLARDPRYSDDLNPSDVRTDTNERLKVMATQAQLEAIYLMDTNGLVLAASNADKPYSFLGQNYGFRPYFQDALQGARSDYFAIGATSGRPGYFVAEPISYAGNSQKGVVAIKLDVSELQRSWESGDETVVAVNRDDVVVLSSNPEWLYRPVSTLDPVVRNAILASRQFGTHPLKPLDWRASANDRVTLEGTSYLLASGQSDWRGWSVHYLQPEQVVWRQTLLATVFFGSIVALLIGFATFLRSRRIELAYAASERQRDALVKANERLEHAQTELARTAKLAALGHLAASVTHELGQPISAFRNHLTAAEIGNEITSPSTAKNLNKLVDRMESITSQFRYFARARDDAKTNVDLAIILSETEGLLRSDIAAAGIEYRSAILNTPIELHAHQVQLEQAFTNILKNAVQAVADESDPIITVTVQTTDHQVEVRIKDNGPGLASANLSDLQEPFFSTKPSGVGMGLGLAITTEIIKDHGGDISLGSSNDGAEFIVTLPRAHAGATQ
ncbi:ATP-binding protein [Planktotalea sp.]|uniref:sensor histidine kinase n=1 Tax=Planktotalea sp. TaxID=2029877 RepID=UPI0032996B46